MKSLGCQPRNALFVDFGIRRKGRTDLSLPHVAETSLGIA
jgi:hypothetical protein